MGTKGSRIQARHSHVPLGLLLMIRKQKNIQANLVCGPTHSLTDVMPHHGRGSLATVV